jgi:hypothetical protein
VHIIRSILVKTYAYEGKNERKKSNEDFVGFLPCIPVLVVRSFIGVNIWLILHVKE